MPLEKKQKAHPQFDPIEAPYLKIWQGGLDVKKPMPRSRLADESLRKVVEEIRKPLKKGTAKRRTKPRGRRLHDGQEEE